MPKAQLLMALALFASATVQAGDEDTSALDLADKTAADAAKPSNWHMYVEAAGDAAQAAGTGQSQTGDRLSLDAKFDDTFAPGWRAVFSDHVDFSRTDGPPGDQNINTLREAYLSWHARTDLIADAGRINVRNGVGVGYNPTDYFRADAVRYVLSIDPASLRENRLGSVMLRGQTLWESGSLTALYSPELVSQPTSNGFSPDFGATNQRDRWQLVLSQKITDAFSPQWLLTGGAGQSPQLGVNATALVNDATVAFVEWSGGRTSPLLAQALMAQGLLIPGLTSPPGEAFRSRLATGLTYTTTNNISLSAEYEYNGTAPDSAQWKALQSGPLPIYGLYRLYALNQQDLATRQDLFFYAAWQDAIIKHLDLTALARYDLLDNSRLEWLEARYHWPTVDVALQLQLASGHPTSDYGASPDRRLLQLVARYYF